MIKFPDGEDRLLLLCSDGMGLGPHFWKAWSLIFEEGPKPGGGPG